jgi:hypothetical protein
MPLLQFQSTPVLKRRGGTRRWLGQYRQKPRSMTSCSRPFLNPRGSQLITPICSQFRSRTSISAGSAKSASISPVPPQDHRRSAGRFFYELNGAFAALLEALGFRVTLLSARVPCTDGSNGPEFDHLTLRVDLGEPWLADVGFGDCFVDPLRLRIGQEQRAGPFRIVEDGDPLRLERRPTRARTKSTTSSPYVLNVTRQHIGLRFHPRLW